MKNKQPFNSQELADQINELVEQLTSGRGEALHNARSLQFAGQALIEREEKRLTRKLGTDHPRVQNLRERRETLLNSIKSLEVEQQLGKIQPVEVDDTEALVEGRIFDESGQGVSGLEVKLVDKNGDMIADEPITSDQSGYFAIKLDAERVKERKPAELMVSSSTREEIYRSELLEVNESSRLRLDVKIKRSELIKPKKTTKPGRQSTKPTEPSMREEYWTVTGTVFDQKEKPVGGATVQIISQELNLRKPLGTARTDRLGRYQIQVLQDPAIIGLLHGTQLEIKLLDPQGRQIFISDEDILFKPGEEFTYDILVDLPDNEVGMR